MSTERLIVCYILAYRQPNYIRTMTLLKGLQQIPHIRLITAINRYTGMWRYVDTLWQLIKIRWKYNPDYYLLGFRGHDIFWLVRLITAGKPLLFDSLMSPSAALIDEKKQGEMGVLFGKLLSGVEKAILHQADIILTDTSLHVEFFSQRFKLPKEKIHAISVGADETLPIISEKKKEAQFHSPFQVLFYGSFLPLHGVPIILQAAAILKPFPIQFTFIGGGKKEVDYLQQLSLPNITHIQWVDFPALLRHYVANTDLGLGGPFGNTPQAQRVITGKSLQFLAAAKPTVIGQIAEYSGFIDKHNCLLVKQGEVESLVSAILWAYQHPEALKDVGRAGFNLYQARFSTVCIARQLTPLLVKK
ncbi:glycosyltransferase [Thioflexithrix psekupsensis]|uniref:Glycosyl transferase family 1 domain-containing protein n=1 Tax=Thioflexithrix psekupsensis TaxID=1570016 RepID=A0A251X4E5_9GAMM|nr:glycosyltransferase [Thioflexithrix psekupsensis]OUD12373.1 hypothetical protein TPSD3_14780 [Thioflexithrix psekupsensis]